MIAPEAPVRSDSFRPVLGATVLLVFALLAIAALKSSRDLEAARSHERQLRTKIAETRASSERLRRRIDRLHHDPAMLERLAREDLGLVRPGDVVIELPEAAPANPHPPAPSPVPSRPPSPGEGERSRPAVIRAAGPPAARPAALSASGPPSRE
ncbi:MAG TPA: septum formation initiator family protein [Thermoanaerobaculia bacterium]